MRNMSGRQLSRFVCATFYLAATALAFSSNQLHIRTFQPASISLSQPATQCYLFGPKLDNYEFPLGVRKKDLPSASLSSSLSNISEGRKGGIFGRLRRMFSFPLRLIMFWPIRLLSQLVVVEDLELGDGTSVIDIESKNEIVSDETVEATSTASIISELNDVLALSPVMNGNDSANDNEVLHVVSGEIFTDVAIEVDPVTTSQPTSKASARTKPAEDRWAIAGDGVDLSGNWQVVVSEEFKREYDHYLERLGQPALVRTVALGIIGRTTEELSMTDGKSLLIRGTNIRGIWDRTLVASGSDIGVDEFEPLHVSIMTADSEKVEAESWWELEGTVHVSFLRGISRYHGGGSFESRRYLEDDGEIYVCESTFYFNDTSREPNKLTWRFRKHP